jgi:hypothetical protein
MTFMSNKNLQSCRKNPSNVIWISSIKNYNLENSQADNHDKSQNGTAECRER